MSLFYSWVKGYCLYSAGPYIMVPGRPQKDDRQVHSVTAYVRRHYYIIPNQCLILLVNTSYPSKKEGKKKTTQARSLSSCPSIRRTTERTGKQARPDWYPPPSLTYQNGEDNHPLPLLCYMEGPHERICMHAALANGLRGMFIPMYGNRSSPPETTVRAILLSHLCFLVVVCSPVHPFCCSALVCYFLSAMEEEEGVGSRPDSSRGGLSYLPCLQALLHVQV